MPLKKKAGVVSTTAHLWQDAITFSARKHRHQLRKDGRTPYFAHPTRVMVIVRHVFNCDDEIALCAAILHDTIEDTTTDFDDIDDRFGRPVAVCVAALTKNMALPFADREREYDNRLAKGDWRVALIKLADAYDNLCDVSTYPAEELAEGVRKAFERAERAAEVASRITAKSGDPQQRVANATRVLAKLVESHPLREMAAPRMKPQPLKARSSRPKRAQSKR